jgi:hypothetical protein
VPKEFDARTDRAKLVAPSDHERCTSNCERTGAHPTTAAGEVSRILEDRSSS